MHMSVAIFMAVCNDTAPCDKNFLNVGQHDLFSSRKRSIKIYRPAIKRNTRLLRSATAIAFLHSTCASTNPRLVETFFTAITLIWTYYTAFKNTAKVTFCKSIIVNTDIGNSFILNFKWRKIFEFLSCFKCIIIVEEHVNEMFPLQTCFPLTLIRFFSKTAFSNLSSQTFSSRSIFGFLHQKLVF